MNGQQIIELAHSALAPGQKMYITPLGVPTIHKDEARYHLWVEDRTDDPNKCTFCATDLETGGRCIGTPRQALTWLAGRILYGL